MFLPDKIYQIYSVSKAEKAEGAQYLECSKRVSSNDSD
jgi:hypothetical protein